MPERSGGVSEVVRLPAGRQVCPLKTLKSKGDTIWQ